MMSISNTAKALLAGLLLYAPLLAAQQSDPGGSPPASPGQGSSQSGPVSPYDEALQPQAPQQEAAGPISGVQSSRVGRLSLGRSFLVPTLSLQETFDTNSQNASTSATRTNDSISNITGRLDLQWTSRRSVLYLDYVVTGFLYNTTSRSHQFVQGLSVNDKFSLGRWSLTAANSFTFTPEALGGLGGYGFSPGNQVNFNGGSLGTGVTGANFNPAFLPAQNILGTGRSISDTTLGQAQYALGVRSSLNVSASFGLVHYLDSGFFDSHSINLRGGYDFSLNAKNTVGISYSVSLFRYSQLVTRSNAHTVFLSYRHRVSGRLNVSVSAGPQINQSIALTGPTGMTVATLSTTLSWSVSTSVSYLAPRGNFNVSYMRWNNEGSGLLLGAESNDVEMSFGRQLTRLWTASINGGYTQNGSLSNTVTGTTGSAHFNGWQGGVSLDRPIGRNIQMGVRYSAARQTSNFTGCIISTACGNVALRQSVGVNFSWTHRPIALE